MTGQAVTIIPVSDRVQITEISSTDAPFFVKHLNEKRIYNRTFRIPFPHANTDAEYFLRLNTEATASHGNPLNFAIPEVASSLSNELIGVNGFTDFDDQKEATLGHWLAKPCWGQGIMTEALDKFVKHALERWKLKQIKARVFETNKGSTRVL